MSMFDLQQSYSSDDNIISKIPISAYSNICNFVLCWKYSKVKTCSSCDKIFCGDHKNNHYCCKEKTIPVDTKSEIEKMK